MNYEITVSDHLNKFEIFNDEFYLKYMYSKNNDLFGNDLFLNHKNAVFRVFSKFSVLYSISVIFLFSQSWKICHSSLTRGGSMSFQEQVDIPRGHYSKIFILKGHYSKIFIQKGHYSRDFYPEGSIQIFRIMTFRDKRLRNNNLSK